MHNRDIMDAVGIDYVPPEPSKPKKKKKPWESKSPSKIASKAPNEFGDDEVEGAD